MNSPELDLYSLYLVRLVAKHRSFTAASKEAGITQSALTRQVQGIEERVGLKLFERTTRRVSLTEPGAILLRETEAMPHILEGALRRIREEYLEAPPEIRIGLSSALLAAHVPGIFRGQKHRAAHLKFVVTQAGEEDILRDLESAKYDLGILVAPEKMPAGVELAHEMKDRYCLVVPEGAAFPKGKREFRKWAKSQRWLLPREGARSRELIDRWAGDANLSLPVAMELESSELMNEFVALEMGVALVPRRSLSGLSKRLRLEKMSPPWKLQRTLVVLAPQHGTMSEEARDFVKGILFS